MTQCEMVMKYIQDFGSITQKEASDDLGIYRLGARIHELSEAGVKFSRKWETTKNRYGVPTSYVRYSLVKHES